jgi:hypothetical protein
VGNSVTERRLVDVLVSHLRQYCAISREVKHYEKRIDVAALWLPTDELWAIEAKTGNWLKAVSQAIVNLAAADRSFVAIYARNVHRVEARILERYGLGLIAVGTRWGDVKIVREASVSPFTNRLVGQRIRTGIQGG